MNKKKTLDRFDRYFDEVLSNVDADFHVKI